VSILVLRDRLESFHCRYLVVTGGEPLLQAHGLAKLLDLLPSWFLSLETNATLWEPELLLRFSLVTASPKLPSAGVCSFPHRVFSRYLEFLPHRLQVKLVVGGEEDWEALEELLCRYPPLGDKIPLVIQPLERDEGPLEYLAGARERAEIFLQRAALWGRRDVRFLPQFHKLLWWGERGV